MGQQLNIKSEDAYQLASELAQLTGESLTGAVTRVLRGGGASETRARPGGQGGGASRDRRRNQGACGAGDEFGP